MACINFAEGPVDRVLPIEEATTPGTRERLFDCEYFRVWRLRGESLFTVGSIGVPRILVCIEGAGQIEHGLDHYRVRKGDVFLLPAVLGECAFRPDQPVNLLEIALPDCRPRRSQTDAQ
jgi:mannose-6-phosphate isomerase